MQICFTKCLLTTVRNLVCSDKKLEFGTRSKNRCNIKLYDERFAFWTTIFFIFITVARNRLKNNLWIYVNMYIVRNIILTSEERREELIFFNVKEFQIKEFKIYRSSLTWSGELRKEDLMFKVTAHIESLKYTWVRQTSKSSKGL